MSELIVNTDNRATIRWKLLTGASAIALAAILSPADMAFGADSGRPVVWIEAEGQFALQSADREPFFPAFTYASQFDGVFPVGNKKPPSVWDESAKLSFQPSDSDWIMSLGVRYGKSTRQAAADQYIHYTTTHFTHFIISAYQNSHAASDEKHMILDFRAGKDFGLGKLGPNTESLISFGVRYAQFDSRNNMSVVSRPYYQKSNFNKFYASIDAARSFRGVGPSLSWDGSANLAGNLTDGSLALDWGVNGALLFGRQKAEGVHARTEYYQVGNGRGRNHPPKTAVYQFVVPIDRSNSVTVPNLGGYAALSLHYTSLRVSLGYRYDCFFGAIDGGIDSVKKEDRAFQGPYASISIGLGD